MANQASFEQLKLIKSIWFKWFFNQPNRDNYRVNKDLATIIAKFNNFYSEDKLSTDKVVDFIRYKDKEDYNEFLSFTKTVLDKDLISQFISEFKKSKYCL